ncbi:MAG: sensor histidine kinase [Chitinophagaceae bacterium]|nr:sensor histidine kinase [Chitinophagaceae bacterium]
MSFCRSLFLPFFVLVYTVHCTAQPPQLPDSLYAKIDKASTDSERLNAMLDYNVALSRTDLAKATAAIEKIKATSFEKKEMRVYASAILELGNLAYTSGNYINAVIQYEEAEKALSLLPPSRFTTLGYGAVYNNLGATWSLLNELNDAQKYYIQGIAEYEKNKDSARLITSYFNLAFIFIDMQQWQKAYEYLLKSLAFATGSRDNNQTLQSTARAAAMCFRLQNLQEGERLLRLCDSLYSPEKNFLSKIYYYNAYGEYYDASGNTGEAIKYHDSCYYYSQQWNDPYYIVDASWAKGRSFLNAYAPDSAGVYLTLALDNARKYNYLPKIRFILNDWCVYYANTAQYEKAYQLRTGLMLFTDSLINIQNHNRILLFDARYQSEKKESQIKQLVAEKKVQELSLRQKNILNYILLAAAVTLTGIGFLFYRDYRQKQLLQQQRITELETEKQLLATEAVLKGEEKERARLAKDLHDGLGGMLSGIKYAFTNIKSNLVMTEENNRAFERSLSMLDVSVKEMRRVAHNLMPEALLKFGLNTALKDFCADINQSGSLNIKYQSIGLEHADINQTSAITVYRIVQELVNNIIKHARASSCIVQVSKNDSIITIAVEDDGQGFDVAILESSKGIGWTNIQSRIDFLKGAIDIQSSPGQGTSVHIELNENA